MIKPRKLPRPLNRTRKERRVENNRRYFLSALCSEAEEQFTLYRRDTQQMYNSLMFTFRGETYYLSAAKIDEKSGSRFDYILYITKDGNDITTTCC